MKALPYLIVIVMTPILFMLVLDQVNQSAAEREYARAAVIREQSQARQDLLAAGLPYVIFGGIVIFVAALGGVAIYALSRRPDYAPPRIIETRTILILQPGQHSRREIFEKLAGGHYNALPLAPDQAQFERGNR